MEFTTIPVYPKDWRNGAEFEAALERLISKARIYGFRSALGESLIDAATDEQKAASDLRSIMNVLIDRAATRPTVGGDGDA